MIRKVIPVVITLMVLCGCSGHHSPVIPYADQQSGLSVTGESGSVGSGSTARVSNRIVWGLWDVTISADRSTVDVVPARAGSMHLNVVRLLEVTPCHNCLKLEEIRLVGPDTLEADVTLTHPFPGLDKYTGFDVRGIFVAQANYTFPSSGRMVAWGEGVPVVLNPDGYTSLFNPTEFPPTEPPALGYIAGKFATGGDLSATLNPFLGYRRDAPRCMFESGGTETRTYRVYAPPGPIYFGYAVDVSWQLVEDVVDPLEDFPPDANSLEAYRLSVEVPYDVNARYMGAGPINVEVFDHQGRETISTVTIEAPDLFAGERSLSLSVQTGEDSWLFAGEIINETEAIQGIYPVLVRVRDTESDGNLGMVEGWQICEARVKSGWARTWGGSSLDCGDAVAIDSSGCIFVTGNFRDTVDFDPGMQEEMHDSNGWIDIFLSKLDPNGSLVWNCTWGGAENDLASGIAIDAADNIYITGKFSGRVDFDPGPDEDFHGDDETNQDAFLSKFDSDGRFVWCKTWGNDLFNTGYSVAADSALNIYVSGLFSGTCDFDSGAEEDIHSSEGYHDAFLSKFGPDGDLRWCRTWGGGDSYFGDSARYTALDSSDNVYVAGIFASIVDFDPGSGEDLHESIGSGDAFLSKFNSDGDFQWAKTWGGEGDDLAVGICTDGEEVYVTGHFSSNVDFDPGPGQDVHAGSGAYLSKFDSIGSLIWARTWGSQYVDVGAAVDTDASMGVYVTGTFTGTVDFDPGSNESIGVSNGESDAYLTRFNREGEHVWVSTWGSASYDDGRAVAVDFSGCSYVTGNYRDTADFDPGPGTDFHFSNGEMDAFLMKLLPDGYW